jgi:hypothetical protein
MRKRVFALAVIFLIACYGKKEETVKKISWLNGNWEMKEQDGRVTEKWAFVNDSLMEGKSDFIRGDTVTPFETMTIFMRDNNFYYEAKAAGQNNDQPVEFKLTSFSDSGFVAENPQHDFPKRITYRLVNKDSIHAFVDGGPEKPDKRSDFFYSRSKN